MKKTFTNPSRRGFIAGSAATLAAPAFAPLHAGLCR